MVNKLNELDATMVEEALVAEWYALSKYKAEKIIGGHEYHGGVTTIESLMKKFFGDTDLLAHAKRVHEREANDKSMTISENSEENIDGIR